MLSWSARMTADEGGDDGRGAADPGRADAEALRRHARARAEPAGGVAHAGDRQRLEGMSRAEAARLAGMERQALRDAVVRYNAEGLAGSTTGPSRRARSG
jgi:hypothetical protein